MTSLAERVTLRLHLNFANINTQRKSQAPYVEPCSSAGPSKPVKLTTDNLHREMKNSRTSCAVAVNSWVMFCFQIVSCSSQQEWIPQSPTTKTSRLSGHGIGVATSKFQRPGVQAITPPLKTVAFKFQLPTISSLEDTFRDYDI